MAGGCEGYWQETGVAGVPVRYCRCGTGSPVVILHHDIGCPDRMRTSPRRFRAPTMC